MSHLTLDAIRQTEEYRHLVETRSRIVRPMTFAMLFVYYSYILVLAFMPDVFAMKVFGGHMSLGIVVSFGVILFSFVLTGLYVHRANTEIEHVVDELNHKADELMKEEG